MSIVRIGMSENKTYGEGYEAIFGDKKKKPARPATKPSAAEKPTAKKKAPAKKGKKA